MFDAKSLKTLEYPKILAELAGFAQSAGGKEKARALMPFETATEIDRALQETDEADRVLFEYALSPNLAVDDIASTLIKAQKGAILSISEIMKVGRTLRTARKLVKTLDSALNVPLLIEMSSALYVNEQLEEAIYNAFLSETEVADNASAELRIIRQKIRKINESIRSKLQQFITAPQYSKYLQDSIITMRSDRYVIPLKSDFKGAIPGLVHDQSASGSTLFVEPMQIVEMNNDLKSELAAEQAEIEKILKSFSSSVAVNGDRIEWCYQNIVDMDVIFAKAQLAHAYKAVRPTLNTNGEIVIKEGRHPLIDGKKVVPISLSLKADESMLLITGPNTGGKTVTLKLVG
ncbi:MAG: endonuclease MutS2, partial [Clostridia bacterium]|nr:endonuclease MutS2 [Clostridia bacterium]